jgi:hypothetical protein
MCVLLEWVFRGVWAAKVYPIGSLSLNGEDSIFVPFSNEENTIPSFSRFLAIQKCF